MSKVQLQIAGLSVVVLFCAVSLIGCASDGLQGKQFACETQADCLSGFYCVDLICLRLSTAVGTDATLADATLAGADATPTGAEYRYVRVDDLSNVIQGQDPGADIDAIILEKADGTDAYADEIRAFQPGANVDSINPIDALGPPDSVVDYTALFPDCNADSGFVSLGGTGYLIVRMADKIEVGDYIAVVEVGGCEYGNGQANAEETQIQVSVSDEPDNSHWVTLGSGEGPYYSEPVTDLPFVPIN